MARSVQWRRTISDATSWRQDQGLQAVIYIVREVGPTGFLLKEEGDSKPVKVFVGDPHSCTCPLFRKERDLCRHLCWLLLKKFRIPREDPISWQLGLVEREINEILREAQNRRIERTRPDTARQAPAVPAAPDGRPALEQRKIGEDDSCPICMEELLVKREAVTYCKYGCANSIHIKCMKIWADHQVTMGEKVVKCPFCREDFGSIDYLKEQYRNTVVPHMAQSRTIQHPNTVCRVCNQSPIEGKCYRCTVCSEFFFCQRCFNTDNHRAHSFEFRQGPSQRWRPAERVGTGTIPLPSAVVNNLMERDIGDNDYDLLLQLDNPAASELSEIPEAVIRKLPQEKVRVGSRYLAPGEQCCVCLRPYSVGELLRKLPCRHKFHTSCIDNWLLHQHPTCPIDGQVVWTPGENNTAPRRQRRKKPTNHRPPPSPTELTNQVSLEIPGVGITLSTGRPANSDIPERLSSAQSAPDLFSRSEPVTYESHSLNRPRQTELRLREARVTRTAGASPSVTQVNHMAFNNRTISQPRSVEEQEFLSLGHLLGTSIYPELTGHSSTQSHDQRDPQTQSGHNQLTDRVQQRSNSLSSVSHLPNQADPVSRLRLQTQGVALSDSESENVHRRRRNMSLQTQAKTLARSRKLQASSPSITTAQPSSAAELYLGNPTGNLMMEVPLVNRKAQPRRQCNNPKPHIQPQSTDHVNLGLWSESPAQPYSSTVRKPKLKGSRISSLQSVAHKPNLTELELTGMRM